MSATLVVNFSHDFMEASAPAFVFPYLAISPESLIYSLCLLSKSMRSTNFITPLLSLSPAYAKKERKESDMR